MKPRQRDSDMAVKQAPSLLDRRDAERVPLQARAMYCGESALGIAKTEGAITDLSRSGCKISGSVPPLVGSSLTLFLYFSDGKPPMCLTQVVVTWAGGLSFAAAFPELTEEERRRIQAIVWKHATLSAVAQGRAAFRIV